MFNIQTTSLIRNLKKKQQTFSHSIQLLQFKSHFVVYIYSHNVTIFVLKLFVTRSIISTFNWEYFNVSVREKNEIKF